MGFLSPKMPTPAPVAAPPPIAAPATLAKPDAVASNARQRAGAAAAASTSQSPKALSEPPKRANVTLLGG